MESIHQNPASPDREKRGLVIEHALLAAKFAGGSDPEINQETLERLREIEEELDLTAHQIAEIALSYYHAQYRP